MNYELNAGAWNNVFAVPASVVDKYIKIAGENSLKLLLYLLRHGGESVPEDKLREALGFSEAGELEDAAAFWVQRGIIKGSAELSFEAAQPENAQVPEIIEEAEKTVEKTAAAKKHIRPTVVSPGEIAERIRSDSGVKMLFGEAEKLYGRPLRARETETLIALTDHFGLDAGAALMLVQYCFKQGKSNAAYILTAAENWAAEEVLTVEAANAKLLSLQRQNGICERIQSELGLKTRLTAKMREFIRVWSEDWGFGEEMIILGYEKTVDAIKEWKPEYENKILESWRASGITTAQAARAADEQRKQSAKTPKAAAKGENSSFDLNDVMERVRTRS